MSRGIPRGIIRHIVGNLHVGVSNRAVIADLRGRFIDPEQWPKDRRKEAYRYAMEVHAENRALYRSVMGGMI